MSPNTPRVQDFILTFFGMLPLVIFAVVAWRFL